jgi:multidrug efflux pump subunit AcrA (membrane-fusion protein)
MTLFSMRQHPVATAALISALALSPLVRCARTHPNPAGRMQVPVLASAAQARDLPLELREIGTIEAINAVSITSRVGGQLRYVAFNEGQNVKKGSILFRNCSQHACQFY